jgi:type VI secretion system protein VasD
MTLFRTLLFGSIVAMLAAACGKGMPPPPASPPLTIVAADDTPDKAPMTLTASADSNPDERGEPKPVVVRVYQLRATDKFLAADYETLFDDNDEKVLDRDMISRDEYVLDPSEQQVIEVAVSRETRFVGVAAGIRNFRTAKWREVVPAPRRGLTIAVGRDQVTVNAVSK